MQVLLACIHSLTHLAPFSMFADIVNVAAMAVVMTKEFSTIIRDHGEHVQAFTGLTNLLFSIGVAIYAVEGIGLVLPLESECRDRSKFAGILATAMFVITSLYTVFGLLGYLAFGEYTKDIVTLNLGNTWQTVIVKLCLCTGLLFTYPVMMTPVYEVLERRLLRSQPSQLLRTLIVLATVWIAVSVPHFGDFLSLVGSSVCCLLSFVLPGAIHLKVVGNSQSWVGSGADYFLIVGGIIFGILGTLSSLHDIYWWSNIWRLSCPGSLQTTKLTYSRIIFVAITYDYSCDAYQGYFFVLARMYHMEIGVVSSTRTMAGPN